MKTRLSKLYEYTTEDNGKGYFFARNEKSAFNKLSKRKVPLGKNMKSSLSHYDNVNKKTLKSQYNNYSSWNIEMW